MQRAGPEPGRGPNSKRHGKRGGRRVLSVATSPLTAAVALAALLFYTSHRFFHSESSGAGRGGEFLGRQGTWQQDGGGAGGGDAHEASFGGALAALQQQQQQATQPPGQRRSSWLTAALLWAEEHHAARIKAKMTSYQMPTGCGLLPCQGARVQRPRTLVLYVYSAADAEQQRNFEFFLKAGVEEQADWLTYRIIIAAGTGVLPPARLPQVPANAAYVRTSSCTTGVWGILSAVAPEMERELAAADQIVVVTSAARGPFMPAYTQQHMHWTDAFTSKLTKRTKMVGSALTCEGAPKGGDAADEWRRNPYLLPYAWAIDKEGWQLLSANQEVFKCQPTAWDARYNADSGGSLALLSAGYNIDTLLAKYQGVDWWNQRTWDCNARVRPDAEWTYDGITISPYETVFVPVSQGPAQSDWSYVRQALKYSAWLEAQTSGTPQGNSNAFVSDAWTLRAPRMIYANSRGPGCFDFDFYVQHNPDMASKAHMHQLLWEHFVLIGQFQGRSHRFTCPVQIGNSYRSAYLRARGRRCFDHNHYSKHNQDVRYAGVSQAHELFNHYADFGQFESRAAKFVCSDSIYGLPKGFDTRPLDPIPLVNEQRIAAKWQGLVQGAAEEAEAGVARLKTQAGDAAVGGVAAQQADAQAAEQQAQAVAAQQQAQAVAGAQQQQAAAAAEAGHQQAAAAAVAGQQAEAAEQQQQADAGAAAATAAEQQQQAVAAAEAQQQAQVAAATEQQAQARAAAAQVAAQAAGQGLVEDAAAQQAAAAAAAQEAAAGATADGVQAQYQAAGVAAAGLQAQEQADVATAGGLQGQGRAEGAAAETVGDAGDAVAFGRLDESEAEAYQQQEAVEQAAGVA